MSENRPLEMLRRAAVAMRKDPDTRWRSVASWLEVWITYGYKNGTGIFDREAIAVARTYLGDDA